MMDNLSIVSLADVIGFILIFIVGYRYGKKVGEGTKLIPKYNIGDCIIFEHDGAKESGVIIRSEVVELHIPNRTRISSENIVVQKTTKVRYMVDTLHVKYDTYVHRNAGIVITTPDKRRINLSEGRVNLVWVDEDKVGCINNDEVVHCDYYQELK